MAMDYINFITEISNSKGSIFRNFYMLYIIKHDNYSENIIEESLKMCGNFVTKCKKEEILKLFNCCFKK